MFAFGSLLFLLKTYRHLMFLQDIFIEYIIQYFFFILFYLTGKLACKMLTKVHRNELNIWLGSSSI